MNRLQNSYFRWLCKIIDDQKHSDYKKLLQCLDEIPFHYIIEKDANRESDGIDLRYRYGYSQNADIANEISLELDTRACSVLEMMVALCIKCEELSQISADNWFWEMIASLGISNMNDTNFQEQIVRQHVYIFMDRLYYPDGRGGLFTLNHPRHDLRDVEIWYQANWHVDEVLKNIDAGVVSNA